MLNTMIPQVCSFIVKSRKIANHQSLKLCNEVLEHSLLLFIKKLKEVQKYSEFKEVFSIILSPNEDYFKLNDQVDFDESGKPSYYLPSFLHQLKIDDFVDVIKKEDGCSVVAWARGQIVDIDEDGVQILYVDDAKGKTKTFPLDSNELAPYESKKNKYEWRFNLHEGDKVGFEDEKKWVEAII